MGILIMGILIMGVTHHASISSGVKTQSATDHQLAGKLS